MSSILMALKDMEQGQDKRLKLICERRQLKKQWKRAADEQREGVSLTGRSEE